MRKHKILFCFILVLVLSFLPLINSKAKSEKIDFSPQTMLKHQKSPKYAPGEIIIKLKTKINPTNPRLTGIALLDNINQKYQAKEIEPIFKGHLNKNDELSKFYKIQFPKNQDLNQIKEELRQIPMVEKADLNKMAFMAWTPNDTQYPNQWGLAKINVSIAWDYTQGSSEVVIANVDSGVDTDHPDIASKIWNNPGETGGGRESNGIDDDLNGYVDDWRGWDFVALDYEPTPTRCPWPGPVPPAGDDPNCIPDNDPNPEPNGEDEDGLYGADTGEDHGTATAGITAATTNNALGIAGVCPNCSVMAIRVLDDEGWGDWSQIAEGIVYAADLGVNIISMSLAGPYDDMAMNTAVNYAYQAGSVLVAAAGNGDAFGVGYDIDPEAYRLTPICNDNYEFIDGGDNQVIGVAATDQNDYKTGFSNYGKKYVDISAPGTGIHTLANNGGYYNGTFGGTSASTPFVAGVAALVKSEYTNWNNKLVRDQTIDLIQNINNLNPSYSGKLGGRLKADRALNPNERLQPSATLIKGTTSTIYLLQNGQKRKINDANIYLSHFRSWNEFVTISDTRVNDYPNGPDLFFRDGTLIRPSSSPTVYQIEYPSGTKRAITSPAVLYGLGYYWDDIIITTSSIANFHPTGSSISETGTHVAGALVKTAGNPAVYLLEGSGVHDRRLIINPTVFSKKFRWQDIAVVTDSELNSYNPGPDYRFQDGALLKGSGAAIYLISYGEKRAFSSAAAYTSRGYNWNQYITVDDDELANYPSGISLD